MTKLECSVTNCVHNSDQCCCKSSILVDGHKAASAEDTYSEIARLMKTRAVCLPTCLRPRRRVWR